MADVTTVNAGTESNQSPVEIATPAKKPTPKPKKEAPAAKKDAKPSPKPAKKTAPAAKEAPAAKPEAKAKPATGIRKPQARILVALSKSKAPLTRSQIATNAPVDNAACVEYLGSHNEETRKANDVKHFPSLLTLGLIKFGPTEDSGTVTYAITAKGTAELAKIAKAAK